MNGLPRSAMRSTGGRRIGLQIDVEDGEIVIGGHRVRSRVFNVRRFRRHVMPEIDEHVCERHPDQRFVLDNHYGERAGHANILMVDEVVRTRQQVNPPPSKRPAFEVPNVARTQDRNLSGRQRAYPAPKSN